MLYAKYYPGHWKCGSESGRQDVNCHGAYRLMGQMANELTKDKINKDQNAIKTKQSNMEKGVWGAL